jgi:hypothetical protein
MTRIRSVGVRDSVPSRIDSLPLFAPSGNPAQLAFKDRVDRSDAVVLQYTVKHPVPAAAARRSSLHLHC